MRRSFAIGGGVLLLGVLIPVDPLGAEPKPPEAKTRIALINLAQVYKDYTRVVAFAKENQALLAPFEEKAKDLKEQIDAHTKALEKTDLTEELRSQHQKKLKARQRELEDLANETKFQMAKKSEEQTVILYKEVTEAAQRYAKAHEIDLVLHYSDVPTDSPDFYSGANVSRKIRTGTLVPLYVAPRLDITKEIVTILNDNYRKTKGDD